MNFHGDGTVNESIFKESIGVIDPECAAEFEAPAPHKRFMKILVDNDVFKDSPLCMTLVTYPPEAKCPPHSHEEAVEIYYVLEGRLLATIEGKPYGVEKGQLIYIPRDKEHYAENRENRVCRFLAIHVPGVSDVAEVKAEWTKIRKEAKEEGEPYAE